MNVLYGELTEVKPCPFCGAAPEMISGISDVYQMICRKCGCSTVFRRSAREAINDWNTRATEESFKSCIERAAKSKGWIK